MRPALNTVTLAANTGIAIASNVEATANPSIIRIVVEPETRRALLENGGADLAIPLPMAAVRDLERHPDLVVDQPGDQPPLAVAEIGLAESLEHFGRSVAGGALGDRSVGVDEG